MYPKFLDEKLKKDLALRGAVDATVAEFEVWLDDSKLPFFPDYTDHGKKHLTAPKPSGRRGSRGCHK